MFLRFFFGLIFFPVVCFGTELPDSLASMDTDIHCRELCAWVTSGKDFSVRADRLECLLRHFQKGPYSTFMNMRKQVLLAGELSEWNRTADDPVFYNYAMGELVPAQNRSEGVPWLERAHRLAPENARISLRLAQEYVQLQRFSEADRIYKTLLSGAPTPEIEETAAVFALNTGLSETREELLKRLVDHPERLRDPVAFADALILDRRTEAARKVLHPLASGKDASETVLLRAAYAEVLSGHPDEAAAYLMRFFQRRPVPVPAVNTAFVSEWDRLLSRYVTIGRVPNSPKTFLLEAASHQNREPKLSSGPLRQFYRTFLRSSAFPSSIPVYGEMKCRAAALLLLNRIFHEQADASLKKRILTSLEGNPYGAPEFLLSFYGSPEEVRRNMEKFAVKGPDRLPAATIQMVIAPRMTAQELLADFQTFDWTAIAKSSWGHYFRSAPARVKGSPEEKKALADFLWEKLPPETSSDMISFVLSYGVLPNGDLKQDGAVWKRLVSLSGKAEESGKQSWVSLPFLIQHALAGGRTETALRLIALINSLSPGEKENPADFAVLAVFGQFPFQDTPLRTILEPRSRFQGFSGMNGKGTAPFQFPPLYVEGVPINLTPLSHLTSIPGFDAGAFWEKLRKRPLQPMFRLVLASSLGRKDEALKLAAEAASDPKASPIRLLNLVAFYGSDNQPVPACKLLERVWNRSDATTGEKTLAAALLLRQASLGTGVTPALRDAAAEFLKRNVRNAADRAALARLLVSMKLPVDPALAAAAQFPDLFRNSSQGGVPDDSMSRLFQSLGHPDTVSIAEVLLPLFDTVYQKVFFAERGGNIYAFYGYGQMGELENLRSLLKNLTQRLPEILQEISNRKDIPANLRDFERACCYDYIADQPEKAVEMYRKAFQRDPDNPCFLRKVFSLSVEKDPETALRCFKKLCLDQQNSYGLTARKPEASLAFFQTLEEKWSDDPASVWYFSPDEFGALLLNVTNLNGMAADGKTYLQPLASRVPGNLSLNGPMTERRLALYKRLCQRGFHRPDLAEATLQSRLGCYREKDADQEIYEDILRELSTDREEKMSRLSSLILPLLSSWLFQSRNFDEFRKTVDARLPESSSLRKNLHELANFCERLSSADAAGWKTLFKENLILASPQGYFFYDGVSSNSLKSILFAQAFRYEALRGKTFQLLDWDQAFPKEIAGPMELELMRQHLNRKEYEPVQNYIRQRLKEQMDAPLFPGQIPTLLRTNFYDYSRIRPFAELAIHEVLMLPASGKKLDERRTEQLLQQIASSSGNTSDLRLIFEGTPFLKDLDGFDYSLPEHSLLPFFQSVLFFRPYASKKPFLTFLETRPEKTFGEEWLRILSGPQPSNPPQDLAVLFESRLDALRKTDPERVRKIVRLSDVLMEFWGLRNASRWSTSEFIRKSPRLSAFFRSLNMQEDLREYQSLMKEKPSDLFQFDQRAGRLLESLALGDPEKALTLMERVQTLNAEDPRCKVHLPNLFWGAFFKAERPLTAELTASAVRGGKEPHRLAEYFAEIMRDHPFAFQENPPSCPLAFFCAMADYYTRRGMTEPRALLAERMKAASPPLKVLRPMLDYAAPETLVFLLKNVSFDPGKTPTFKTISPLSRKGYSRLDSMIADARGRDPAVFLRLALLKEFDPFGPDPDNEDSDYSGHVEGVLDAIEKSDLPATTKENLRNYLRYNCRKCAAELEKKAKP